MARSCRLFSSRWPPRYLLVAGPRTFPGLGMSGIVAVIFFFFDAVRGFNVDTARPEIFASADGARLGERVVQFGQGMDGWLGVSGQDVEGAGALYRCMLGNQTCAAISLAGMMNVSAQLSIGSSGRDVVVCDPTAVQHCLHNSWVPGFCFRYTDFPHEGRKLDVKEKECIAELVDVVFLFDGSNSLSKRDLKKNKDFMLNMMQQADDNMQFAVVQYSMKTKIEMDFNTFQKNRHRLSEIMAQIELMESATFTATGINVTLNHVFTEEAGSRHGSSQLLIVITDGAISNGDLNLTHVIRRAEERGITRCAIGVGSAFTNGSQALRELQTIASSPAYLIQVKNYNELNSIFNDLKTKMYKIEGTHSSNETSFELEMAQMGFSVLLTEESVVLGAVGAYDGSGGLLEIRNNLTIFINVSKENKEMKDAYLGYSVKEAVLRNKSMYVVGAPRYQHKGKVIVFSRWANGTGWETRQEILGEQIGSNFGSELCTLDLTGNGETDVLLIGAPLFYQQGYGGLVSLCPFTSEDIFSCTSTLRGVQGETLGRFGSTIAALRDLNGDRVSDVAVGAPLEDGHRGSVYIFLGQPWGVESRFSQRITARQLSPALRYFGQSVQGSVDLTGDGLTDIAVGATRHAILLSSRPVVEMNPELLLDPEELELKTYQCPWESVQEHRHGGMAQVCFTLQSRVAMTPESLTMKVMYKLVLDGDRQVPRAQLLPGDEVFTQNLSLLQGRKCHTHMIKLPVCVEDSLAPIKLTLNFSITPQLSGEKRNLPPIICHHCPQTITRQLPMQNNCGADRVCTDHLIISLHLGGVGTVTLGRTSSLELTTILRNMGEDSYDVSVLLSHPPGLTLRRLRTLENAPVECSSSLLPMGQQRGIFTCNVSHPIFRQHQQTIFKLLLEISGNPDWGEEAWISAEARSNNNHSIQLDANDTLTFLVRYAVKVVVMSLPSARYVHFRRDEQGQRDVIHRYKVENLGPYPVPLTLTLSLAMFPLGWVSWDVEVLFEAPLHEEKACRNLKEGAPLNSTGSKVFKQMVCQLLSLPNSFTTFDLKGSIIPLGKTEESLVILSSCVTLSLNSSSFINDDLDVSLEAESQTEVQIVAYSRKSLLIYSSVGGLLLLILIIFILWKFGFFKRRSKVIEEKMIGASRDTDPRATANEQEAAASEKQELANGEEAPANGTEE